jgi:hypothetical protein
MIQHQKQSQSIGRIQKKEWKQYQGIKIVYSDYGGRIQERNGSKNQRVEIVYSDNGADINTGVCWHPKHDRSIGRKDRCFPFGYYIPLFAFMSRDIGSNPANLPQKNHMDKLCTFPNAEEKTSIMHHAHPKEYPTMSGNAAKLQ